MRIDRKLLKECISDNRVAQKQLYELLLPYLRAIAMRYLRDTSYVKDVLQESFVNVFKNISKYNFEKAPLNQWAARITINSCINYNKRVIGNPKEELIIEEHETASLPSVVQSLTDENMLCILKTMPEGYFEVFNLFVIDGYTHDEIAAMLDISEALSRKRLSRARVWLKKTLSEKYDWVLGHNLSSFF